MKKSTIVLLIILGIIIVAGACFGGTFLGAKYFESENKTEIKEEIKEKEEVEENTSTEKKEYKDFTKEDRCWMNETCTFKYTFEKQEDYVSEVKVNDLYTYAYGMDYGMFFYILKDGDVYYSVEPLVDYDVLPGVVKYDFVSEYTPKLEKLDIPSKIKRIKGINFGSGVEPGALFISEDGKVYTHNGVLLETIDEFAEYEIDDILDFDNDWHLEYKVVLKDGTIFTKERVGE